MSSDPIQELTAELHLLRLALTATSQELTATQREVSELRTYLAAAASAPAPVPPPPPPTAPTAPAAPAPPASSSSSESTERISTGVFDSTGALLFRGDLVTLRTSSKGRFRLLRQFQAGDSAIVHGITFNRDIKIHLPHNPRITTVRAGASVTKSS